MAYFENYQRQAIQPGYVDQEGDYAVKIVSTQDGNLQTGERYKQVNCAVNYKGQPKVSIFLTEGEKFNAQFTAFLDTFGILNPNDCNSWIGRKGYVHILLKKKDGFTNMVPRWILNDDGYVMNEVKEAGAKLNNTGSPIMPSVPSINSTVTGPDGDEYGDIPF